MKENIRKRLRISIVLGIGLLLGGPLAAFSTNSVEEHDPPNIILIMCDDLGWGDVGFNGNEEVKTPNLDKLAGKGLVFSRFYSAGSVCSPTRASCITGRNPTRMGILGANTGHLKPEEITLPELLKARGYTTGHFGKWHLGTLTTVINDANRGRPRDRSHYATPAQNGYDVYFSTESKVPTWDPLIKPKAFDEEKGESLRYGWAAVEAEDSREITSYGTFYWKGEETIELKNIDGDDSRIIMDRVVPFMESAQEQAKPFFTTIWFHTPHLPVVAPKTYRDLYPELSFQKQLLYGSITAMDQQVGRLWEKLEEMGIEKNTMIWFCSDNGPEVRTPGSAGPFRAKKRSLYEGGVRVPAFCIWPDGIPNQGSTEIPAVTSDYLPTILNYLNIEYPDQDRPLDGINLRKIIEGTQKKRNAPIGFQYRNGRISWVMDRHKLIRDHKDADFELYDLPSDSVEAKNIAAEHPRLVENMKQALNEWLESCRESEAGADY